jgi:hypothetical protein
VRYDDATRPVTSNVGRIFPLRSRQNTGVGSLRSPSVASVKTVDDDIEAENYGFDSRDIKKKQARLPRSALLIPWLTSVLDL